MALNLVLPSAPPILRTSSQELPPTVAMKLTTLLTALTLGVADVSGHYIFQQLSLGTKKFAVYENIRKNTNQNSPVTSLSSNDLRCNVGGASGASTTVVSVKAGDDFTFTSDTAVYHQGPISLYVQQPEVTLERPT